MSSEKCFCCDAKLNLDPARLVDTRDGQLVYVGATCYKKIKASSSKGYQPVKGGPKLYLPRGV